jgi:hypothetical protein
MGGQWARRQRNPQLPPDPAPIDRACRGQPTAVGLACRDWKVPHSEDHAHDLNAKTQRALSIRGESIERIYGFFLERRFLVNRRYQRKLVWTLEEKQAFIDSLVNGYPVPLVLLAEVEDNDANENTWHAVRCRQLRSTAGRQELRFSALDEELSAS